MVKRNNIPKSAACLWFMFPPEKSEYQDSNIAKNQAAASQNIFFFQKITVTEIDISRGCANNTPVKFWMYNAKTS